MLENNHLIGFGAGGDSVDHLYWRIRIYPSTGKNYLGELRFLDSLGANLIGGGTPSGTTPAAPDYGVDKVFDGSTAQWNGFSGSTTVPSDGHWVAYQFPSPVAPSQVSVAPFWAFEVGGPDGFYIEHSDDGLMWTDAGYYTPVGAWSAGTFKTFDL